MITNVNDISIARKKHGWYEVNNTIYLNKYQALENCKDNEWPQWNFHNDAYSQENWTKEPEENLYDLYCQRAWQIRKKYNNVILYYSGGIDSHVILNTFVENNIPLDGIIVSGSYSLSQDLTDGCDLEQLHVAKPYLDYLIQNKGLTCPIHYLDTTKYNHEFRDENWVYSCGQSLTPQVFGYQHFWRESWIQNFLRKGSTCFVKGIDKPRVILENNKWFFSFMDGPIMTGNPTSSPDIDCNWDMQEYFYWTPDFTKIVRKQAHILINWFENNLSLEQCQTLTSKEGGVFDRVKYNNYVDPLIYDRYTTQPIGGEKTYFSLGKPFMNIWRKDFWFFKARDVYQQEYQAWTAGVKLLSQKISPHRFNKPKIKDQAHLEKFLQECHLGPEFLDLNAALFGTVGCWSKFYYIKDVNCKNPYKSMT